MWNGSLGDFANSLLFASFSVRPFLSPHTLSTFRFRFVCRIFKRFRSTFFLFCQFCCWLYLLLFFSPLLCFRPPRRISLLDQNNFLAIRDKHCIFIFLRLFTFSIKSSTHSPCHLNLKNHSQVTCSLIFFEIRYRGGGMTAMLAYTQAFGFHFVYKKKKTTSSHSSGCDWLWESGPDTWQSRRCLSSLLASFDVLTSDLTPFANQIWPLRPRRKKLTIIFNDQCV